MSIAHRVLVMGVVSDVAARAVVSVAAGLVPGGYRLRREAITRAGLRQTTPSATKQSPPNDPAGYRIRRWLLHKDLARPLGSRREPKPTNEEIGEVARRAPLRQSRGRSGGGGASEGCEWR